MLDATASREAKRAGQQQSIFFDGEWIVAVMAELRAWLAKRGAEGHTTMTMEQFRHDAVAQPHSHKSWGSLPALACREGLIAPMNHPDGSPVMRRAESAKTHAHPVRVWLLSSLFLPSMGARASSEHHEDVPAAQRHPKGIAPVSDGRHSGSGADLLGAVTAYHCRRDAR